VAAETFVSTTARPDVRKPWFCDLAGIHLVDNLDSLSRDEIEATQQHNLRATLTAARQSANVWRRFPRLEAVDTVDDLAALPLLSGADLAAGCPPHSADLVFDTRSPGLVLRSSGTASRPKILYHSFAGRDFTETVGGRTSGALQQTSPRREIDMKVVAGQSVRKITDPGTLETLRAELDRIDAEFLGALGARVAVCRSIAHYKREHAVPMMQPHRIGVVQQRAARFAEANGLDLTFMKRLYDLIIGETCRIEDLIIDAGFDGSAA
jgi:chorismate mutase-like protein